MAYCANCGGKLILAESDPLSTDKLMTTHYTHYCTPCNFYWHLHFSGSEVVLSSSKGEKDVGMKISTDLITDLKAATATLESKP